ncbi:MAG: Ig-like domain-containing protein [Acidobacteria bacterium]|nr:Ig-like domain-containing protein [Acidobacteriota bacterium]
MPTLDGAWTGLLDGDVAGATYTTTGTSASPAGTYPIVPTPVDAQSVLANYTVTVISGTLTIRPASETVCYVSTRTANVGASQTWWTNVDGTLTIRTTVSRTFNDNTYGNNQIGWPGRNHTFNHLVTSDMVQVALYDATGARRLEMKLDYISVSTQFPSGYGSLGVSGGDGGMVFGSANHVMGADSSLAKNFNQFGYVLTSDSPATDANYTTNATYPNWIWDMYYDVTISPAAFGAAGFGYPRITSMHASPSKSSIETEPLVVTECIEPGVVSPPTSTPPAVTPPGSAPAPTGVADSYTVRRGQTLTVSTADGVLANDPPTAGRSVALVNNVSHGSLTLNADGSFTYQAQNGWTGDVTFTYAVKVGSAQSVPITVTIAVTE